MNLNSIKNNDILTEYVIKLLEKNKIVTLIDFLKEDINVLKNYTNLSTREITFVKADLRNTYGSKSFIYTASHLIENTKCVYTNIKSFDQLLEGGLISGYIYEFCGLAGSGKTEICNTIAMNLLIDLNVEVFYIDTKCDFSGCRLYKQLIERKHTEMRIHEIMKRIRVERIYDPYDLHKCLQKLLENIKLYSKLKLLIIDSLPSIWFLFDEENFYESQILLTKVTSIMRELANKYQITVLIINIITTWLTETTEQQLSCTQIPGTNKTPPTCNETLIRKETVALNKYWQSVPSTRFLIERYPQCDIDGQLDNYTDNYISNNKRLIKIVKSNHLKTGKQCTVHITNTGVV